MKEKEVKRDVTERVKTFEDAQAETGRPGVPEFSDVPEDMRPYFKAQYKIVVIAQALNEGWKPDWTNGNQKKWVPWFGMSSSGVAFNVTYYYYSYTNAGTGSRLCFKTEALANYAGRQFVEIWDELLQK
ncbi:MAG TPA: hypothetical protein DDW85_07100 [Porphyromonadaceae bacterium]|nr:hypothetical protein [Porphyromonadaceae bacterium]